MCNADIILPMNSLPFDGSFHHFCDAVVAALGARGTFDAEWFASSEGQRRLYQSHSECLSFETAVSELELWCKGFVRNRIVTMDEAPIRRTRFAKTITI